MSINKLDHFLFVGFNGYAVALNRDTGEIAWSQNDMSRGFVTLLLDEDRLIASTNGYIYCLDPYTGDIRWHNPMTGYGYGPTSLSSVRGQSVPGAAATSASALSINKLDHLLFVGFNGYAVALNRDTGEIVWSQNDMNRGYVSLLLDGDLLIASTNGYIYCLDPHSGEIRWNNPMTGYGYGPTSLVSVRGQSAQSVTLAAAAAQAAAAAAASASAAGS